VRVRRLFGSRFPVFEHHFDPIRVRRLSSAQAESRRSRIGNKISPHVARCATVTWYCIVHCHSPPPTSILCRSPSVTTPMVSRHLRSDTRFGDSGECSNTLHSQSHSNVVNAGATHQRDSQSSSFAQTKHQRRKLICYAQKRAMSPPRKTPFDSADGIYQQGDQAGRPAAEPLP